MALGVVSRGIVTVDVRDHCNGQMIDHGFAIRT